MEALGATASAITVVELTAKLGSLCLDYTKAVKNSAAEINELKEEVASLENAAKQVRVLLEKPEGQDFEQFKSLDHVLQQSRAKLKELEQKLESKGPNQQPEYEHKAKRRKLARALKWPFQREEVNQLIQDIRGYHETISHILQVHQT
ncbi:uncharacterized protein BROUX77_004983 [Berkeleyomyces rouxiae]|uniref:uncharacterized protein n=1 Tax=Berkeleyomyces rouxiae TaxID=2035830 RepID=UPI003B7C5AA8